MRKGTVVALGVGAAWLAASTLATAQHWGRERTPNDGICFYKDKDYRGDYFCARTAESLSFVPDGLNDRISSIRIFGRAEVTVFSNERFGGRSGRFNRDVPDLRGEDWNDRISSIRVEESHGRRGGGYEDASSHRFHGDPDRVVRRAYEDILGREPDSAGLRLYRSRLTDDGWSETEVREALRKSPEYREKNAMTRERAAEVVRRAYRAALSREPDASSSGYVDRVLRDHWTQSDVERELRKSPEYRQRR